MTLRNGLLAGGVALLAVVAAVGWSRKTSEPAPMLATTPGQTTPAYDAYGQPVNGTASAPAVAYANPPAVGYAVRGEADRQTYYAGRDSYADERYYAGSRRPVRVVHQYQYAAAPAPVEERVREREYYVDRHGHRRSTGKSVAIVAGSAAGGAAIGAIAGGGKGAGIGALAGGGAGFIYDRLTHNHVH
jgi:hypothetical protein